MVLIVSTNSILLMGWIPIFDVAFCWIGLSSKVVIGVANTFDAWGVFKSKVISRPTPIWGGVKGMVVVRNSKFLL